MERLSKQVESRGGGALSPASLAGVVSGAPSWGLRPRLYAAVRFADCTLKVVLRIAMLRIILISIALLATPTIMLAQSESQTEIDKLHREGHNFFIQRDFRKALEAFQKELTLRRAMHDKLGEAWALNQIGESYSSLAEYGPALGRSIN